MPNQPSRRSVLKTAGAVGAFAAVTPAISACGGGDGAASSRSVAPIDLDVSAVEVGGGALFKEQGIFVTQPAAGEFHAFDATCPHQGCAVTDMARDMILCPCHGSYFDKKSGERQAGPAKSGLGVLKAELKGTTLTVSS